jgi:hypothetical protein
MTIRSMVAAAALFAAGVGAPAMAADLVPPPDGTVSEWEFAVAAYLWAAGLDGDVAAFGAPAVEVDASFSDILDVLKFGAMGAAEIRNDRFGFFSELIYTKIGDKASTPFGVIADSVGLTNETLIVTGMLEYRVLDDAAASLDVMAGARIFAVSNEIDINDAVPPPGDLSVSDDEAWVDPMIGVKGRAALSESFYLTAWGMIGGFGVSSDLGWDAFAGLGYEFNDRFSMVGGYRALGVDYTNDEFVFDVVQHGPIFGGVYRFQ